MSRYKFNVLAFKPTNVVVRASTPVDEFHFDEIHPAHCSKAMVVSNPLYVLFNQQRLQQLGQFPLQEWIDAMNNVKSDPLKELRSKISDEDLISLMKSRYCQKPSEIAQWSSYLASRIDDVQAEVQQYIQAQQQEKSDVVEEKVEQKTD